MSVVLSEILKDIEYTLITGDLNVAITSVEEDSRKVTTGTLFVAVKGNTNDAHRFIPGSINSGVTAILVNKTRDMFTDEELLSLSNGTTIVAVENTREALALIISAFYDHPETKLNMIGVTGTKGKTTTTFMLHEILRIANQVPGLIGTVCNIVNDKREDANHTTPVALELYSLLNDMVNVNAQSCVMEVSSLGVKQNRVSGLKFKVGCFTNFFRDHISPEEHPTMEDYLMSKLHMFDQVENAVINIDTNEADSVLSYVNKTSKVVTYGLNGKADVTATNITKKSFKGAVGTSFELVSPWYKGEVFVALPGIFNVYNALCAISVAGVLGIPFEVVTEGLASVRVPGRVEPVSNNLGVSILVDYAHNGESLKSVLKALREYTEGKIISVFGCGGNRSSDRRIGMGEASGAYADYTVITTDNPRDEEPMAIIEQIIDGIKTTDGKYEVVVDRTEAIEAAINMAKPGDLVLIAGKGHENYQIVKGVKSHFDDKEKAADAIIKIEAKRSRKMFSLSEICEATGGKIVSNTADLFVTGVSKDTRTIEQGNLYIALKGENFDGHDFCKMALDKGASVLLVSDESKLPEGASAVVVEDTLKALGDLAKAYRFKSGVKVVAVTGSVGKTSTREMIAGSLAPSFKVFSTKRNENNEIGLPMTILSAPADTEVMVLEMGMRLRNEISYLTNIACPDFAVITNVGYCHIERLGSREEIRLAKMEIVEGLLENGILAINGDDDFLCSYASSNIPANVELIKVSLDSKDNSGINAANIRFGNGIVFDVNYCDKNGSSEYKNIHLNLSGIHNVRNALFAILCTIKLGGSVEKAIAAVSEITEMNGRGKVTSSEYLTVINDAYNAAPESMAAAFFNLNLVGEGKRKIAVLGGMLELGDYAPMLHEETGKECGKYGFDHVFVTGEQKDDFVRGLLASDSKAVYTLCEDSEDCYKKFMEYCRKGDVVLFKASNAFGFQKLAARALEEGDINE